MDIAQAYVQILPQTNDFTKQLKSSLSDAGSEAGTSAGGKFSSALGTAAKVGAAAVGVATAAVSGFAASSVAAGTSFDKSMSQVAATMGKTTDEIQDLRNFAQKMGSETSFSATEAADALNYMALAGYDSEKSMSMLPNVLNLAAAGGLGLATASDMVTDASSALGLSMEETERLVDKMAQASSKSNTSVGQLGEAILTVGGTAKNLAGGTTELSTALGILADNGVKGSEGGTALRNMILSLSAPTDKAKDALIQFGGAEKLVYDQNGNMRGLNDIFTDMNSILGTMSQKERTEVLNTIFNKVDLKSVNAMLSNTAGDLSNVGEVLADCGVEWTKYSNNAKLAQGSAEALQEWSQEMLWTNLDSAEGLADMIEFLHYEYDLSAEDAEKAAKAVAASVQNQASRWDELSGSIDDAQGSAQKMADTQLDNLAGDVTLFKSALEGAQIAVSDKLTPSLRDFVQLGAAGLSSVTTAFKEDGLTGAIQAFSDWLGTALGKIIDLVPKAVETGAKLLGAVIQGIADNIPQIAQAAVSIITSLTTALVENLPLIVSASISLVGSLVQGIMESLPQMAAAGQGMISNLVVSIRENLPNIIATGLQTVMEFSGSLRENIGMIIDSAIQLALALAQGLIDSIPDIIRTVPTIVSNIAGIINDNAPKILAAGVQLIIALVQGLVTSIPVIIQEMPKIIAAIWDTIRAINWINLGSSIITGLKDGVVSMVATFKESGKNLIDTFKTNFTSLPSTFLGIGKNIITGLINGIKESLGSLVSHAKEIAVSVIDTVKNFFGIHSPSTVFSDIGKNIISGLINGVKELWGDVTGFFKNAASAIPDFFKGLPDAVGGFGKSAINALASGATTVWNTAKSGISSIATNIGDAFSRVPDSMKIIGSNITAGLSNGLATGSRALSSAMQSVSSVISGWMTNLNDAKDSMLTIGGNLMTGLANGLTQAAQSALNAARNAASAVVSTVKSVFGVASPSKVFAAIGGFLMDGLAGGIENGKGVVKTSFAGIADDLTASANIQVGYNPAAYAPSSRIAQPAEDPASSQDMLRLLEMWLPRLANMTVKLNSGAMVGELAPGMDQELGLMAYYQNREVVAR